ncbi:hypothetical protein DM01DRAFT_1064208 [Hesseltinella vesiculosa]|uniref:Uncharacterized protein n=1 Tax=Hesseltinella vesiculosa TaxID=101127 RepID=A0A1X2GED7_9FUNG|nr:hypothetical protein DM01DRAFT_1064208 [Hesseltinella vesiculosa]
MHPSTRFLLFLFLDLKMPPFFQFCHSSSLFFSLAHAKSSHSLMIFPLSTSASEILTLLTFLEDNKMKTNEIWLLRLFLFFYTFCTPPQIISSSF